MWYPYVFISLSDVAIYFSCSKNKQILTKRQEGSANCLLPLQIHDERCRWNSQRLMGLLEVPAGQFSVTVRWEGGGGKIEIKKGPKSTLLADKTRGLITTKQTKPRHMKYSNRDKS